MNIYSKNITIALLAGLTLVTATACRNEHGERTLSPIDDEAVYSDKTGRYRNMSFIVFSYVDYTIFNITVMPLDGKSLSDGVQAPSVDPEFEPTKWGGMDFGQWFAWDTKWKTPKQFKVWWQRVTDKKIAASSSGHYDPYTEKRSQPGTAWCEEVITVNRLFTPKSSKFLLHFYPDGHIEATTSELYDPEENLPRVRFEERKSLPVLVEKACRREIANPYFGLKRPIKMH